jgi:UDP-N-acetylglucosamine:LPS N-acetylglucosamine transferase
VIVELNAWTLPQERYNAEWVEEQGVGIVLRNLRSEIAQAVDRLLDPATYARYHAATGRQENRAVCEIPEILQRLAVQTGA